MEMPFVVGCEVATPEAVALVIADVKVVEPDTVRVLVVVVVTVSVTVVVPEVWVMVDTWDTYPISELVKVLDCH